MSNIELARISFLLLPCAWIHFAAFVSVVSWSFPVSGCKVITFLPYIQINLQKSFLKNCKRKNKALFVRFVVCALSTINATTILIYLVYMCAYVCAFLRKRKRRKK